MRAAATLSLLVLFAMSVSAAPPAYGERSERSYVQVTFPSEDGLKMTADVYAAKHPDAAVIVLFHQARWSRGEYRDIAPKLGAMGFSCIAVDQRSGTSVNGVKNETYERARRARKQTSYLDARPDLRAAMAYARKRFPKASRYVAWGSSYSASLALALAGEDSKFADAVLAFSPGEYFGKAGKERWVATRAAKIRVPVFITSGRKEARRWKSIFEAISGPKKRAFVPKGAGMHGARALWSRSRDSAEYWKATRKFLRELAKD